jgi:hypothetical protein
MRRILAVGTPSNFIASKSGAASEARPRPATVSRGYKRPAKPERKSKADALAVIPTNVTYAPGIVDKDSRTVEAGGVTGRMLAKRAREAEVLWRASLESQS